MDSPISAPSSVRRRTNTKPANLLICSNLVYRDLSIRDLQILCARTGLEKNGNGCFDKNIFFLLYVSKFFYLN